MNRFRMAAMVIAVLAGTAGIAAAQDGRYYDRDDGRYSDRDDYRYGNGYYNNQYGYRYDNFRQGMNVAREFGYRDGAETARQDSWRGKAFNPNPRGRFDDADHGYQRAFGNKHEYREQYIDAYREGYQENYSGNGYYR